VNLGPRENWWTRILGGVGLRHRTSTNGPSFDEVRIYKCCT
jgi:hypothetical protein